LKTLPAPDSLCQYPGEKIPGREDRGRANGWSRRKLPAPLFGFEDEEEDEIKDSSQPWTATSH
jgi:hypothetical protein